MFAAFALLCHKQGSGLEEFNSWMTDSFFAEGAPFFDCLGDTEHASVKGILSTKWMWGQDTKRLPCAPTRNGLAQFLFLTSGQLRLIVILPSLFPPESAAMSLDETIEYVKGLTVETFATLSACGGIFSVTLEKFQGIYLPAGCIVAEQCVSNTLLFGLRFASVFRGHASHALARTRI